jgi:hypothetical protein
VNVLLSALHAALALVLLGSGGAKAADLRGFAGTLAALGLPARWAVASARGVVVTEVGVGAASLANLAPRVTSVAVFALALGFVAVAALATSRRPQVRCRCFGALTESRFGPATLVRSVVLAAGAGVVVVVGGEVVAAGYGIAATVLLLVVAALFTAGCAAASTAIESVRRGAVSQ